MKYARFSKEKISPLLNAINVFVYAHDIPIYDWCVRLFSSTAPLRGSQRLSRLCSEIIFVPKGFSVSARSCPSAIKPTINLPRKISAVSTEIMLTPMYEVNYMDYFNFHLIQSFDCL